jgi:hypothetical protein
MPSFRQRTVVIVGGSDGGLVIGNMLRRRGWAVDIFEHAAGASESRGAGIAGNAELTAIRHPKCCFIKLEDTVTDSAWKGSATMVEAGIWQQ